MLDEKGIFYVCLQMVHHINCHRNRTNLDAFVRLCIFSDERQRNNDC